MPGKSQLQQFNKDLLSIGDEVTVRAGRGEKPVSLPIPKDIKDINDSEDFVLGMPINEAAPDLSNVDEDLSDITNLVVPPKASSNIEENEPAPSFEAPDMSSILSPAVNADVDEGMPDLSMFDEPVEEEPEPEPEPEPVQVSVADMGLDALLAGAGFDNTEGIAEEESEEEEEPEVEPLDDLNVPVEDDDTLKPEEDPLLKNLGLDSDGTSLNEPDFDVSVLNEEAPAENFDIPADDLSAATDDFDAGVENFDAATDNFDAAADSLDTPADTFDVPDDLSAAADNFDSAADTFDVSSDLPDFDAPGDLPDFGDAAADLGETADDFDTTADSLDAATDNFNVPDNLGAATDNFDAATNDFDAAADNFDAAADNFDAAADSLDTPADDFGTADTFDVPDDLGSSDLPDFDMPGGDLGTDTEEDLTGDVPSGLFNADDMEMVDVGGIDEAMGPVEDFDDGGSFDETETTEEAPAFDEAIEDVNDFDSAEEVEEAESLEENGEIEQFDTTGMDDMDFGIPETDAQFGSSDEEHDFELGEDSEFAMEGDFEIPGFSDVTEPKASGPEKIGKDLENPDFSKALKSDDLPPNTLSDEQYQQFLKNLHEYPLNVRLAFEDLIVQDEFTDDAEFEIIEKILNKVPARSVASTLEKMLDISLPVPRDYENRTAEEYEAYKKSLAYQLKNKIIPGILVGIVALFVGWGLFNFSKNCIYKPIKAVSLYKQGYTLLQKDEYPQSEMKFKEASSYRLNKKWFFNYARGYREHKQYQRADKMYQNILICFNHDKIAGLEYADMHLNDLANYERAEEIVRREILDYHINDQDGILKLGDVFLEWGTEKDSSKLELAREQYATLIQLYGSTDLYQSRMMRYFIRSDNLRQVLQVKGNFEGRGKEKSLSAEDWTELSGYLLEKYYGPLAPSDEYLRYQIEGLRKLLITAVNADKTNPVALYNLSKYFINSNENEKIEGTLKNSIEMFNQAKSMRRRDIYKYIDAYRLLGEYYKKMSDYLQAQEQYAEGISLYTTERDNAGFTGNKDIGKLYQDLADLKYFISGDYDEALLNYMHSVELENDSPSIRYRIGYIQYNNKNYVEALGSFMKAGDGNIKERNLMLAMANTLSLRGDDYAAEGYYEQLIHNLDEIVLEEGILSPQKNKNDYDVINTYLYASNNYGVTLYRLAKRTGNSSMNGEAIVQFSQSLRAWDALTRNPDTLVRLGGSNLAEQNIQYITHPIPNFEPTIYSDIQKTLTDKEKL